MPQLIYFFTIGTSEALFGYIRSSTRNYWGTTLSSSQVLVMNYSTKDLPANAVNFIDLTYPQALILVTV